MKNKESGNKEPIDEKLMLGEVQYRQIFCHSPLPSFLYNPDSLEILDVNNSALGLYCYSREEFLGMTIRELCLPEEMPDLLEYLSRQVCQDSKSWHHKKKDGSVINVEITDYALNLSEKKCHVFFVQNVTEQIQAVREKEKLQTQLFQSRKMEAAGQIASAIAHDFNNILTSLTGYGSLLEMELPEESPLKVYAEEILASANKAANLTQSLLAFNRKQSIHLSPCNLNDIITDMKKLLKRLIREDIVLDIKLAEDSLPVMADISQINQVIVDLSLNARDAMPGGGILTIETKCLDLNAELIKNFGKGSPGKYALLSVSETGIGMDETTKEIGQGAGLGLSIVLDIVRQHNGFITVQSKINQGTIFYIHLPLLDSTTTEKYLTITADNGRGTETILLAENSETVRKPARAALEKKGYTVIEAVDGEDALHQFQQNRDVIDFLIIDVIMPKKNGKAVYNEIKKTRPDIKVLFTSGYTKDIIADKGICDPSDNFLPKPLSTNELLQKVREILDQETKGFNKERNL